MLYIILEKYRYIIYTIIQGNTQSHLLDISPSAYSALLMDLKMCQDLYACALACKSMCVCVSVRSSSLLFLCHSFCPLRNLIMHTKMSNGRGSFSHRFYTRIESCPRPGAAATAAAAPVVAAFFMLQCVQFGALGWRERMGKGQSVCRRLI